MSNTMMIYQIVNVFENIQSIEAKIVEEIPVSQSFSIGFEQARKI
jgi:hypothetical protein